MAKGRSPLTSSRNHHSSPRTRHHDSPSRQLHVELERTFAQLQLFENERQQLHAFNRKSVQDELDARETAQAIAHRTEIENAIVKHELVRQQAVAVLEAHIKEERIKRLQLEEAERRQREEEERRIRQEEEQRRRDEEERRRIKENIERKAKEEKEKAEAARRAAAEKAIAEEAQRRQEEREATVEREKQARARAEAEAETGRKQREAAKVATVKSVPVSVQAGSVPDNEPNWSTHPEIRHRHYLNIHKYLKAFRKDFWDKAKKDPQLKPFVGEMRRLLKTSIGQLTTDDKRANTLAVKKVKDVLLKALHDIPSPPVVLNNFLPPHLSLLDKNTTTVPSLVLYLLSMFTKAIVNAFVNECAINVKAAEPIGTMVAQVFSMKELQFKRNAPSLNSGLHYTAFGGTVPTPPLKPTSVSLISIFMCKIHKITPILFGVSGGLDEKTTAGRERLGWRKEYSGGDAKSHVSEAAHHSRMAGIGAGYASVALRNFSKTALTNPWPSYHFWESLSYIVGTNPAEIQPSHCYLLKSMLEINLERFLQFFGDEGVAALRTAFIEFPKRLPPLIKDTNAGYAVRFMADTWKKEKNFTLE